MKKERYQPEGSNRLVFNSEFNIEIYVNRDKLTAMGYYGRKVKPAFNYRFTSLESLKTYCKDWFTNVRRNMKATKDLKAENKRLTQGIQIKKVFPLETILYSSWGYEQTNIDFYQVIGYKGKKTLIIRPIGQKITEYTQGMAGNVIAVKNAFIGEERKTQVRARKYGASTTINYSFGGFASYECLSVWDGQELYKSWYA